MKNLAQVFDAALRRAYRDMTATVAGIAAIALALATFAQGEIAWCATNSVPTELAAPPDERDGAATFDEKALFIEPDFEGCDLAKLYESLKRLPKIEKDEYETTLEFEKRKDGILRSLANKPIYGALTLSSRFATEIRSFRYRYDADAARFLVRLTHGGENSVETFKTSNAISNLFGDLGLGVHFFGVSSAKDIHYEFGMPTPNKVAYELRDKIHALLVFTIDPRLIDPARTVRPVFSPEEPLKYSFVSSSNEYRKNIFGADIELWVYNKSNGEVLMKQPLARGARTIYLKEYDTFGEPQDEDAPVKSRYDALGFNESDTKIDRSYQGVDIELLSTSLCDFWSALNKDEFESVEEYKERRKEFLDKALDVELYGECNLGSRYAVVVENSEIVQVFDAENRFLILNLNGFSRAIKEKDNRTQKNSKTDFYSIRFRRNDEPAIKAFGNFVTVVDKDRDLTSRRGALFYHSCSAADAMNLKGHINALIVFSIDPELYNVFDPIDKFTVVDPIFNSPGLYGTFSRPIRFESYWRSIEGTIYAKDVAVWFYDNRTGEVFKKSVLTRGYVPGGKREKRESAQESSEAADADEVQDEEDEDADVGKPMKNWYELLAESVDTPASWERKEPTIIVPDDVATLPEAVSRAQSGDVIMLRQSSTPYTLGLTSTSSATGLMLDKPIAIVGETGRASDVVLQIGVRESVFVETKGAMFKGITLSCGPLGLEKYSTPIVTVGNSGYATFKNCEFHGAGVARSIGAQFSGQESRGVFWKCVFRHFAESGVLAKDASAVKLEYCEFLDENHYGVASETNASILLTRCHFVDNIVCICANSGGGCKVVESRAEVYKRRADISPGSRNKYEELDSVFRNR